MNSTNRKKPKTNDFFHYFFLILAIIFSPDTLLYGTNVKFRNSLISILITAFLGGVLVWRIISNQNGKLLLERKTIEVAMCWGTVMLLGCFFSSKLQNINGYLQTIIVLIIAVLYISQYSATEFLICFENVSMILITGSLICYFIHFINPNIWAGFPLITNIGGSQYKWLLFTMKNIYAGNTLFRNSGIFREPGVFQMYINMTLWLLFSKEEIRKTDIIKICICIATCITTFSSGGLITVLILITIVLFTRNDRLKSRKSLSVFLILVGSMVYMSMESSIIDNLFLKITDLSNESSSSRVSSIYANLKIFTSYPLFGIGATSITTIFANIATEYSGVRVYDNTNTLLYSFAAYGVIVGALVLYGLYSFFRKIGKNTKISSPFIALFLFVLFANENVYGTFLFFVMVLYGYTSQSVSWIRVSHKEIDKLNLLYGDCDEKKSDC